MSQESDTTESNDQNISADSVAGDAINIFRGFCMGAADTVPGVSGGTVALILGHYDRLIAAISQVDSEAVAMLMGGTVAILGREARPEISDRSGGRSR